MRKRLIIGAIAVVVGVAAYVLSPGTRSLEYHKKEYLDAMYNRGVLNQMSAGLCPILGKDWQKAHNRRRAIKLRRHSETLIEQGFLIETTVAVSNRPPSQIASALRAAFMAEDPEFVQFFVRGTNMVRMVGTPEDMPKFEKLLRDFDVPPDAR